MSSQNYTQSKLSSSPSPKTAQHTTHRYVSSFINSQSNQKFSHSPFVTKTPTRQIFISQKEKQKQKQQYQRSSFIAKSQLYQPSILPVSFSEQGAIEPQPHQPYQPYQPHHPPHPHQLYQPQSPLPQLHQVQRLKLAVVYLQQQVNSLRQQNQQISRQKKTLNENYIQLINKQIQTQQTTHHQITSLQHLHAQQLTKYSHHLSSHTQSISRLQLQAMKHQEELQIQLEVFRDKENSLLTSISQLEQHVQYLEKQCHKCIVKVKQCESVLGQKEGYVQELQLQASTYLRNVSSHQKQHQSLSKLSSSLQAQNHTLSQTLSHLQAQLTHKQTTTSKLTQQLQHLLSLNQQCHHQLSQHHQTLNNLQHQNNSLSKSYSQLLTTSQHSTNLFKQRQHSLINQINSLKVLQAKLREQNLTLIKHIDNFKDRQTLLIESEKSAREKLANSLDKKNKLIQDLCMQNQRLYKEINKIKFNHSLNFNETQSTFIHNLQSSK